MCTSMPEPPRVGLGLPPLALQAVLDHLTLQASNALLLCSRSVRHEVLLCSRALSFTPGAKPSRLAAKRSKQLREVLQQRRDSLKLTLDLSCGPPGEELAAFWAEVAATRRPVRDEHGARSCCVDELVLRVDAHTDSMHGSCDLLGAALPHITSLQLDNFNPDVQLMSGLAACSRLTKLDLGRTQPTEQMTACAHLLPTWLPHVHTLACYADTGSLALARQLSAQLQHWKVGMGPEFAAVPGILAACTQLVSVELSTLRQATLDALAALPNLREVSTLSCLQLRAQPPTQWGVQILKLGFLHMTHVVHLPLNSVQQLVVEHGLDFELQRSPAASGAAMREACSRLARVPQLQLCDRMFVSNKERRSGSMAGGQAVIPPEQCGAHLEAALAGLQPLAGRLPSLFLSLQFLGFRGGDGQQVQMGPEVLRGLHVALGDTLTKLTIQPSCPVPWAPGQGFWAALPDMLPQLQTLQLRMVAPLGATSAVALSIACAKLHAAGRHLELVFKDSLEISEVADQLGVYQPNVRVMVMP